MEKFEAEVGVTGANHLRWIAIIIVLLSILGFLTGCEASSKNITENYELPPELKDCSIYRLQSVTKYSLSVVRCPNSTTATHNGKDLAVIIDGREYVTKENRN